MRWTVFKSQFCGFAAQKYSTKPQLKNCRLARRYASEETELIIKVCLVIFLSFLSIIALACDCPKITTLEQDFSNFKFVTYGVIKRVENDATKSVHQSFFGEFQALEVFKGSASSVKTVRGGAYHSEAGCMVKLEPGEYLIYSNEETAFISQCNISENISNYSVEKKAALLKSLRNLSKANNKL